MSDHMTREEWPCPRLPKPVNGSGPSVYLMQLEAEAKAVERQRLLWEMASTDCGSPAATVPDMTTHEQAG